MNESVTIHLPRGMSLLARTDETSRQIKEWLSVVCRNHDLDRQKLHLKKCELRADGYYYDYAFVSQPNVSEFGEGVNGDLSTGNSVSSSIRASLYSSPSAAFKACIATSNC